MRSLTVKWSMDMPMVNVRVVRVAMPNRCVHVRMLVLSRTTPHKIMGMLVVRIVAVCVVMLQRFMKMVMNMVLREVKPHPPTHQRRRDPEHRGCRL